MIHFVLKIFKSFTNMDLFYILPELFGPLFRTLIRMSVMNFFLILLQVDILVKYTFFVNFHNFI